MNKLILSALAVASLALTPAVAFAHAHLRTAAPAVGGTVHAAPSEVALDFTEALEPRFSSIAVTDASGARVDQGEAHTAPGDGKHFSVALKPLAAGTYTVTWHATSVDTHKTQGSFRFTVAP